MSVEESEDGKEDGRVSERLESQWCRSGNSNVRRAAATWTDYYYWGYWTCVLRSLDAGATG